MASVNVFFHLSEDDWKRMYRKAVADVFILMYDDFNDMESTLDILGIPYGEDNE